MARVTVEDCLQNVDNRFDLVMVAAKRARRLLSSGEDPHVAWENDKPTVVALREIAEGHITQEYLNQKLPEQLAEEALQEVEEQQAQASTESEGGQAS